ncbi:MAG: ABC transporter substrate-binding protein [Phycisphaeraceae bacterium]
MREHLSKIVIVALLVIVVGLPFALRPAIPADEVADADAETLIVFTPHNEQIRHEFARAFNAWRTGQDKAPVRFDWRAGGGTSDLRRIVISQLEAKAEEGREDEGVGGDLFFGGGEYEHDKLAQGVTVTRKGKQVHIPAIVPIELPDGMLKDVFPQPTIGGERLYHPDHYWYAAVVSSFGIIYNRDVLDMLNLPAPRTWSDLQSAAYFGWIALSDPAHSGSIGATYNTILRRHGWTEGWRLLRRTFANASYFTSSASQIPVDISAGEGAAGMCIDFYGRFQAGAVGEDRVGYVDPQHMTATTADPIAVLRGAPNHELAREFLIWTLSKPAQRLWQRKIDAPDGPHQYELRRQPVRRDLYDDAQETQHWTDPNVDPFAAAKPIPEAMPDYYLMVAPVSHAMAIDVHDDLVAAWRTIQRTPRDDPRRAEMLRLFDAMPQELRVTWPDAHLAESWPQAIASSSHARHEEAASVLAEFNAHLAREFYGNPSNLLDHRLKWTRFFRSNYRKIVALGKQSR